MIINANHIIKEWLSAQDRRWYMYYRSAAISIANNELYNYDVFSINTYDNLISYKNFIKFR